MRKIIFLIFLCLFLAVNADTESVKFMNNAKEEAKKLGAGEIKRCKAMPEKERQLWAANYTGRAEELNFVVQTLGEDVKKAYEAKNISAAEQGEKTIDLLIKRTAAYLYLNGIYRDNCDSSGIDELFDNMLFE
ncbi:hypothetical protein [Sebaldella sp. S0638]|uniref:hypothetical protein n=1 Tax=Sebaldella sp. S0638 TaxID=2957809 RepID=UPI00209D6AF9|nr:hypothetical protein [Sebaldella sp. S0638]MCP1223066.1 hypothetical protein [Sebaldella sp. S0638]